MARLWFVRTRRIVTQYGITDLRSRLAAALWELRRLRRELPLAQQGERIAILALARERGWKGDDGDAKTQSAAMPAAMPAAGQADDGARKTQCDTQSEANRAQRIVTNWLGDDGLIHWSED